MEFFSEEYDVNESVGEAILEALCNSNIFTIQHLNLAANNSWFSHPQTKEEREGTVDLLVEIISRQIDCPNILNLGANLFSSSATEKLLTLIAARVARDCHAPRQINLSHANFESDQSVEKLAEILAKALDFKKLRIGH